MKKKSSENCDVGLPNPKKARKYFSENKLKEICSIFLNSKSSANILIDLLDQFIQPTQTPPACVSAVENIFVEVLQRMDMTESDEKSSCDVEKQYKEWLRNCYEDALSKVLICLEKGSYDCKLQALNTLFQLLLTEAKYPLTKRKKRTKSKNKTSFPTNRLKEILKALSLSSHLDKEVLKRMSDFSQYKDVRSNMWLALDSLVKDTCKQQPVDLHIKNIFLVLHRLPKDKKGSENVLCELKNGVPEEKAVKAAVESVWKQLAPCHYSMGTHQLILVVLVEYMMPLMDNAIYLTDYFMDALNRNECEISMLALQGIFNLVIEHNIEYPNIYGKLYQLYSEEALNAKYKTRLFALTDQFLCSSHLPLALVAAFAKRFSRLLLIATPPDQLILMTLTGNLLIRHPDLRFLYHNPDGKPVDDDPYLENELDPLESRATESQLYEVKLLQHHYMDRVARMANFINHDLRTVEYELEPLLELTWSEMIQKDLQLLTKKIPKVAEKFEGKPLSSKMEEATQKELKLLLSDFSNFFDLS